MNPELWDAYAAKFGNDVAVQKLGPRPSSPGMGEGLVRAGLQGATLGTSDEIAGGIAAVGALWPGGKAPGQAYTDEVGRERERMAQFGQEHPVANIAGQMAGAVIPALALGPAVSEIASLARPVGTVGHVMTEGAIFGGAAGAGRAQGGPVKRLKGAVGGGFLGAATAGLAKGATGLAGRALDATGLRPSRPTPMPSAAAPATAVQPKPGFAARAIDSAEDRADDKLLQAMQRDKLTTADVRAQAAANPNAPLALIDAGPKEGNVLNLAKAARTLPGEQKAMLSTTLEDRGKGELGRLRAALVKRTGLPQEFSEDTADEIVRTRAANAKPLYDKLEGVYIKDPDETFTKILDDPAFAEAYKRGARIAKRQGYKVPDLYDADGNFQGNKTIPVRVFDYVNRGLRDMRKSDTGIGPAEWGSIQEKRVELLNHVDELVPEFKAARKQYAGDSELLDAWDEADGFWGKATDFRSAAKKIGSMAADAKNMFRRRAMDDLLSDLGDQRDMTDQAGKITSTPNFREKLRLLFDKADDAEAFLKDAGLESRMDLSRQRLSRGSDTAENLASQADALTQIPRRLPTNVLEVVNMGLRGMSAAGNRLQGLSGRMGETLAQRLTAGIQSREDLEAVLGLLDARAAARAAEAARGSTAGRVGSSLAGRLSGDKP